MRRNMNLNFAYSYWYFFQSQMAVEGSRARLMS